MTPAVVYRATVEAAGQSTRTYVGLTEPPFKTRFSQHKHSFRHTAKRSETTLSQHVWALKDTGATPVVTWDVVKKSRPYKCGSRACGLCDEEKLQILLSDPVSSLNKRSEIVSKCRHMRKFKLCSVT